MKGAKLHWGILSGWERKKQTIIYLYETSEESLRSFAKIKLDQCSVFWTNCSSACENEISIKQLWNIHSPPRNQHLCWEFWHKGLQNFHHVLPLFAWSYPLSGKKPSVCVLCTMRKLTYKDNSWQFEEPEDKQTWTFFEYYLYDKLSSFPSQQLNNVLKAQHSDAIKNRKTSSCQSGHWRM